MFTLNNNKLILINGIFKNDPLNITRNNSLLIKTKYYFKRFRLS